MTETLPVLVLGAGPSGLAVAACLRQRGIACRVIEQRDAVGARWRMHYERLHLHTVKHFSALPGMKWPNDVPLYPSRNDVIAYLDAYARRFEIEPLFGETVERVEYENDRLWSVRTNKTEHRGQAVVVATGYNRVPNEPKWPGIERFGGTLEHAMQYRNGRAWRGKRALVVGAGNTGAEIALDLWESGAHVQMCVRSPVHVMPRDVLGVPAQINSLFLFGRLPAWLADRLAVQLLDVVVGDLHPFGIVRPSVGPATQLVRDKTVPWIDVGTVGLVKQGHIKIRPAIARFERDSVVFENGDTDRFDLVLLATGYRAGLDAFLPNASQHVDARGIPIHSGEAVNQRGLFFLGYRNPLQGQLYDIAREARLIAETLSRRT